MRILHTSDLHLGAKLDEYDRSYAFENLLHWMRKQIDVHQVEALIIAGDVFDTKRPPQSALNQYYKFLASLVNSPCQNVVVTAGNHDSPALLEAPGDILKLINVRVVGSVDREQNPFELIVELKDKSGAVGALCCALPYVSLSTYESTGINVDAEERERQGRAGFAGLCADTAQAAEKVRAGRNIPIIMTGHCWAAGSDLDNSLTDVQKEQRGNLDRIPLSVFPQEVDYVALGHIHRPGSCGGKERIRYSGSPLPLSFDELGYKKSITLLDFDQGRTPTVTPIEVPSMIDMRVLKGSGSEVLAEMKNLNEEAKKIAPSSLFVRVKLTEHVPQFSQRVREEAPDVKLCWRVGDNPDSEEFQRMTEGTGEKHFSEDDLRDPLNVIDLFLGESAMPDDKRQRLRALFMKAVEAVRENEAEAQDAAE